MGSGSEGSTVRCCRDKTEYSLGTGRTAQTWRNISIGIFVLAAVLLGWYYLLPIARIVLLVGDSAVRDGMVQERMLSPETYETVARELALCCQTVYAEISTAEFGNAVFPDSVRNLDPAYGSISPAGTHVGMRGGFDHYGYYLQSDEKQTDEHRSTWHLFYYTESLDRKKLTTVTLDRQERIENSRLLGIYKKKNSLREVQKDGNSL